MKNNKLTLMGGSFKGLKLPIKATGPKKGELFVKADSLMLGGASPIEVVNLAPIRALYDFASHSFFNAGAAGRLGPTLAQLRNSYTPAWCKDASFLNIAGAGVQVWTVPEDATYSFRVRGATRGNMTTGGTSQLRQLLVRAVLKKGWKVYIAVGQQGLTADRRSNGSFFGVSAGGGGTFVYCPEYSSTPIVVAGGAGGNYVSGISDFAAPATAGAGSGPYYNVSGTRTESNVAVGTSASGSGGNAGAVGGGGGFKTSRGDRSGQPMVDAAGVILANALAGGIPDPNAAAALQAAGGFGGGGSGGLLSTAFTHAGGGGGYTGGYSSNGGYNGASGFMNALAGSGGHYWNPLATVMSNAASNVASPTHGYCEVIKIVV